MDINQYLNFQTSQARKNYLHDNTPKVAYNQVSALWLAMIVYINSDCVNKSAPQVQNAKNLLEMKDKTVMYFIQKVLSSIVFNYLLDVLPDHMGNYHYHAGICKGMCGYGTNRIVAIVANTLIEMNLSINDIKRFPDHMVLSATTAIDSEAVRQIQGTGISYNFVAKNCSPSIKPDVPRHSIDDPELRNSIARQNQQDIAAAEVGEQVDNFVSPYQLNMYHSNIRI